MRAMSGSDRPNPASCRRPNGGSARRPWRSIRRVRVTHSNAIWSWAVTWAFCTWTTSSSSNRSHRHPARRTRRRPPRPSIRSCASRHSRPRTCSRGLRPRRAQPRRRSTAASRPPCTRARSSLVMVRRAGWSPRSQRAVGGRPRNAPRGSTSSQSTGLPGARDWSWAGTWCS